MNSTYEVKREIEKQVKARVDSLVDQRYQREHKIIIGHATALLNCISMSSLLSENVQKSIDGFQKCYPDIIDYDAPTPIERQARAEIEKEKEPMNLHQYNHEHLSGTVAIPFRALVIFAIIIIAIAFTFHYIGYRQCSIDVRNIALNVTHDRFRLQNARIDSMEVEVRVNRACWNGLVREFKRGGY